MYGLSDEIRAAPSDCSVTDLRLTPVREQFANDTSWLLSISVPTPYGLSLRYSYVLQVQVRSNVTGLSPNTTPFEEMPSPT